MNPLVLLGTFGLSVTLIGCGGGGGDDPAPSPGPPTPPPGPAITEIRAHVVSFNLEWWKVAQEDLFAGLNKTINSFGPYDLMGFQECDNITKVIQSFADPSSWALKQGPDDVAIAWNTKMFKKVKQGDAVIAKDSYGNRYLSWAQLNIIGTDGNVFFANAHGALNVCNGTKGQEVAANYVKVITENRNSKTDTLIFTGDFNCQSYDDVIQNLRKEYTDAAQASQFYYGMFEPDHIFTDGGPKVINKHAQCCPLREMGTCELKEDCMKESNPCFGMGNTCCAFPSDHQLLQAYMTIPVVPTSAGSQEYV